MSITKTISLDKVEFVGEYARMQVRHKMSIIEDGEVISEKFHRTVYEIQSGIENLPEELQPYATGVWTDELLAKLEAENAEWYAQQQALEETAE